MIHGCPHENFKIRMQAYHICSKLVTKLIDDKTSTVESMTYCRGRSPFVINISLLTDTCCERILRC